MENTFSTEHIPLRSNEIQDTIFREHVLFSFFYSREKILCVYIFYSREKILCVFHNMTKLHRKKKDLKIRFLEYGAVVNTRRSVLTYLYIIYYIKRTERRKHPKGDNYTRRFVLIFFI